MKVFLDARMVTHPGIGRYTRCLLPALIKNTELDLTLLGNSSAIKNLLSGDVKVIDFDYPVYSMQEQLGFRKIKKMIGDDILHVPHYNIPVLESFNLVVTIHDLIHILYPQGASKRFASVYMRFTVKRVIEYARTIICVSYTTKEALAKLFDTSGADIRVIHEGVSDAFCLIKDTEFLSSIKQKYNLPDKFILYVGSIRRHKNIGSLLEAFSRLCKKIPDVWLVTIGKFSHFFDFAKERVMYLGEVPDDRELAAIYNLASVFCNLSLYEGFSLTVLEAQKCGLPVVASNISTHVETGADGCLLIPPTNIEKIEDALYNTLTNESLRKSLVSKGFSNISRFDWNLAGQKTFEVYKDADSRR